MVNGVHFQAHPIRPKRSRCIGIDVMLKIKATHYWIYVSSHTPCSRINYVDLHLEVPLGKGLLATYPILSELKNILQHDHAIFISIYIATARMVAHSFQKKNGRPFLMCFIRLFNYQHRRFQRLCPKNLPHGCVN